jgi:putative inorganic carbon (HCO3(-)) transporter
MTAMLTKENSWQRREQLIDSIAHYLFCLLVIWVPLAVYPKLLEWYNPIKLIGLRTLAVAILGLWAAKAFFLRPAVQRTKLDWLILLFLSTGGLSAIFAVHPATALLGSRYRYDGLSSYALYAALYFTAIQFYSGQSKEVILKRRELIKFIVGTAALISLYGITQYFGFELNFLQAERRFELRRSFATLGNPVMLGSYLTLMLPLALALFLSAYNFEERAFFGISSLLIFFSLVTTYSRGAWLGTFCSLIIFSLLLYRQKRRGFPIKIEKRWVALAILSLLLMLIVLTIHSAWSGFSLAQRAETLLNLKKASANRIGIWESIFPMIAERPLLGIGPDNLGLMFPRYETKKWVKEHPNQIAENAHNFMVQVGATFGLIGLLLLLSIAITFFLLAYKSTQQSRENLLTTGLLAGAAGYLIQLLFGVTLARNDFMLWLVMGVTVSINALDITKAKQIPRFAPLLLLLATLLLAAISIRLFLADLKTAQAGVLLRRGEYQEAITKYKEAITLNPWDTYYLRQIGGAYISWGKAKNNKKLWQKGIRFYEKATRKSPADSFNWIELGNAYLTAEEKWSKEAYLGVARAYTKVEELRPNWPMASLAVAKAYLKLEKPEKAYPKIKQALSIDSENPMAFSLLAQYYESIGKNDKAWSAWQKAQALHWQRRK